MRIEYDPNGFDKDKVEFECTGRKLEANRAIIGLKLGEDTGDGRVFGGYDHAFRYWDDEGNVIPLTPEERKELAEFMASEWRKWGEAGGAA